MGIEAFRDAELCLMDIDEKRLEYSGRFVEKIINAFHNPAVITMTTNRREALRGADGIICTVYNGGNDVLKTEVDIPYKYGVSMKCGGYQKCCRDFQGFKKHSSYAGYLQGY